MNFNSNAYANTRWREFVNGVKAELPILLGVIPFGLIYGALATSAGLPMSIAQAMSAVVFAGSAQFVTAQLIAQSAPYAVMILTAAILNLRHVLYSASLAPHLRHLPFRWKAALSYLLTDEAYAVVITRYTQPDHGQPSGHWYFLGAGLTLWVTWQISTAVGIATGALVPPSWSLDFALPLTFIAIVVPAVRDRPALLAATVAGAVSVAAFGMPLKLSLIAATLTGIVAGLAVESFAQAQTHRNPTQEVQP